MIPSLVVFHRSIRATCCRIEPSLSEGTCKPRRTARFVAMAASAALTLLLLPGKAHAQSVKSVTIAPTSVVGGTGAVATITLTKAAGLGGLVVSLASDQPCATVPASIKVPAASASVQVNVTTTPVSFNTTATLLAGGGGTRSAGFLTVQSPRLKTFVFTPAIAPGGATLTGNLTLTGPAPTAGLTIWLANRDLALPVPDSVSVTAGSTTASFTTTTLPVAVNTLAVVNAYLNGGLVAAAATVLAPTPKLTLSPATVTAGKSSTGTVTLTGPAPPGGVSVSLAGVGGVAALPATLTVAAGATTNTFPITTNINLSGTETITATLNGKQSTTNLVVTPVSGLAASAWPKFKGNTLNSGLSRLPGVSGTQKWVLKNPAGANFGSPVLGADGTIYVGADNNTLYAVNPKGTIKWSLNIGAPFGSIPAVGADGTLYLGANDNRLHAVNPDGTPKWTYLTGLNILSSPTIGPDGTIYFGSADGRLYAINTDGTLKWSFKAQANIYSSPALAPDGTIYFGSEDNFVYALNSLTGAFKWSFKTGHVVRSSPAIAPDGTLYVGSWDSYVYALSPAGVMKWKYKTGPNSIAFPSPTLAKDGTIYVGSWNNVYFALNPNGTQKWSFPMPMGTGSSPAVAADGTLYAPCDNGSLYAVTTSGAQKWVIASKSGASCPAIGADGTVYVSLSGSLYAIH